MINVNRKINKLLKALELKGQIHLMNREQIYSPKLGCILNKIKLYRCYTVEEYNKIFPNDKKDPKKQKSVKKLVAESFKGQEILIELVRIYQGGD